MLTQDNVHRGGLGLLVVTLLACTSAGCVSQPKVWIERTQTMPENMAKPVPPNAEVRA